MKSILLLFMIFFPGFFSFAGGAQDVESAGNRQESAENIQEVNVYTHRHYDTDQKLYDRFYEKTGIKVNVVKAGADELLERLKSEGMNSPADVLLTVDVGRLHKAIEMELLQPVRTDKLVSAMTEHLRHPDGYWYGLTKRARVLAYSIDRVNPDELSTYEDLVDEKWKGKIAVRSSSNIYNQSLLASIIATNGKEMGGKWAEGIVANMAREPKGNDRDQVKAIASGQADIAIINSYYLGKLLTSSDEEEVNAGKSVALFFPNQEDRGAHINISGGGVTAHAPNKENAISFLEFLVSEEAQKVYAQENFEYPIRDDVEPSELVASWGTFEEDRANLDVLGKLNVEAVIEFDKAGWK